MRIQNGILITIENGRFENGYVDFEDGVITAFGDMADAKPYDGEVLDAEGGYIMPGFIDAHTHIGISEEGMRWEGEDCNETVDPITPDMRIACPYSEQQAWLDKVEGLASIHPCTVTHLDGVRLEFEDGWVLMRKSVTAEQVTLRGEADTPERLRDLLYITASVLPESVRKTIDKSLA